MKIHPRDEITRRTFTEARIWLAQWEEDNDITPAEAVQFYAMCLATLAKYSIREERREP